MPNTQEPRFTASVVGAQSRNTINGTDGDDIITGTSGDDTINGGDGVDEINGGDGNDVINGGADGDFLFGDFGDDQLFGDGGNDRLSGGFGNDVLDGGDGDDSLFSDDGNNIFRGGAGNDTISDGFFGNDQIFGDDGNDRIAVNAGDDLVEGGAGDDEIRLLHDFDGGNVVVNAGTGNDSVEVAGQIDGFFDTRSVDIDLGDGADTLDIANLASDGFEVTLGAGADRVRFFDFSGSLVNRLSAGPVRITDFELGDGGDFLQIANLVSAYKSTGGDTIEWVDIGADMALRFSNSSSGESFDVVILEGLQFVDLPDVNTDLGGAQEATNFIGTRGSDEFIGSEFNDTFTDGGGGNDTFVGRGGDDQFTIQRFAGGDNNVSVDGGAGNDSLFIDASVGGFFTIDMGEGDDFIGISRNPTFATAITLGAGSDTIRQTSTATATILDFETGDGGDIIDLNITQSSVDNNGDPFGTGELVLFQDGNNVVLQRVSQFTDGTITTLAVFQNTLVENFTSFNFGGIIDPAAGGQGDTFEGTENADTYTGTAGADTINGNGGDDTLDGADGNDTIDGGAGNDALKGGFGDDVIRGGDGDDVITEAFGTNMIYGDGGNDTINISGYFGSSFSLDPDQIFGGEGNDTVNFFRSSSNGIDVDLGAGEDRIVFNDQPLFNEITLGAGSDVVDMNSLGQSTYNPTRPIVITDFQTGDGGDRLEWESWIRLQTDNVSTPDFNPFAILETSLTQVGNDVHLEWSFDTLNGASSLVIFQNTQVGDFNVFNLEFDPNAPIAPGDDFTGTENDDLFNGTNVNDTAAGLGGSDRLNGRAGDDTLDGGIGDDTINGDQGNDTLIGGDGDDTIRGGTGADDISGGDGNDFIDAGLGDGSADIIDAGAGDDQINFSGSNDTYIGGDGIDELFFSTFSGVLSEAIDIDFTDYLATGVFLLGGQAISDIENILYAGETSAFDDRVIWGEAYTFGQDMRAGAGNDLLSGTSGDDTFDGEEGDDTLIGLGGNDSLTDLSGNNRLEGGQGNDTLTTGEGDDTILGGDGDDVITPGGGIDNVDAGAGDDRVSVIGFELGEVLDGGEGTDVLQFGSFDTALNFVFEDLASSGTTIANFEEFDFVFSTLGDTLILGETFTSAVDVDASSGNDVVTGGASDDTIVGGSGSDILRGGSGDDIIRGENIGNGTEFDQLFGDAGNDQLFGNGLLEGGAGNDFVSGSGELFGGDGNDSIVSFGIGDIIRGGAGDDDIFVRESGATIYLEAGLNRDRIDGFSAAQGAMIIATAANSQLQWTALRVGTTDQSEQIVTIAGTISDGGFAGFEIIGTGLDDTINLSGGPSEPAVTIEGSAPIFGLGGNDDITGSLSDDIIFGGAGNDILRSSSGLDQLHGGVGDDRYFINHAGQTLIENAGEGFETVIASVDVEIGDNIERLELQGNARIGIGGNTANEIFGTSGNNELYGRGGNDVLHAGFGDDLLDGGAGDDLLIGLGGNNTLRGGDGNDVLRGNSGNDVIDGGSGVDTVDFSDGPFGVTVDLSITTAQNLGGAGTDTLTNIENVIGTLADDTITGSDGANVIFGNGGFDTIDGGSNVDIAVFTGTLSQYTIVQFVDRTFGLEGPGGLAQLSNIEFIRFDDQLFRLRPGIGQSVNFNSADPATYQDAMSAIRDFDGNALGGDGAWLRIGEADVNGDGDIDQILVNDAIGRFATVGTAPDGLVYFEDFSWAGETRVAGIYIDPLVQLGIVEQGSPFDSQQRFQNDLAIENINRVLGADDYDGDGLQEVYFALTDGTAYLRAIMEFDGNIRYANYQDEQGVIDYLTANGFGEETYGTWFGGGASGSAGAGDVAVASDSVSVMPVSPQMSFDPFQAEMFG
ncbi:hypothetical protein INR77_06690 [Erythrobacter sp. SCSIO 43205]|uniref:beta strand repeat-containing protein n=1 Tax=Erythrobacter sp. SCSIO 43205 TaxID=2779361 RepID=UPI001CA85FA4|nr:calcium-binding protein [Erythrobacter sp. SCSIO 43205]UAB79359.1 hypothetical protein INR77_06690 [Erythrobacter sp. SCSIO 43205]